MNAQRNTGKAVTARALTVSYGTTPVVTEMVILDEPTTCLSQPTRRTSR